MLCVPPHQGHEGQLPQEQRGGQLQDVRGRFQRVCASQTRRGRSQESSVGVAFSEPHSNRMSSTLKILKLK